MKLYVGIFAMFLAACGSDSNDDKTEVDAGSSSSVDAAGVDADNGGGPGGNANCLVDSPLGAIVGQAAFMGPDPSQLHLDWVGGLNTNGDDLIIMQLFENFGPFTSGLTTGTFDISGSETDFNSCGVCVRVFADIDPNTGVPQQQFMATSGTVTVTNIDQGLSGVLDNLTFSEIELSQQTGQTFVSGGCSTSINGQLPFSAQF